MRIIFLDIDGVLNCENHYTSQNCTHDEPGGSFYEPSKILINRLIDETEAKVVISSTWRHSGLQIMRDMWKARGMSGEVIDITPSIRVKNINIPRGLEIDVWLEDKGFSHIDWSKERQQEVIETSGIDNYIIIDDDANMLYKQRNHFVHVLSSPINKDGFGVEHFEKAKDLLSKTIIELNY